MSLHLARPRQRPEQMDAATRSMLQQITHVASLLETHFRRYDLKARAYNKHFELERKRVLRSTGVGQQVVDASRSFGVDLLHQRYVARDAAKWRTAAEEEEARREVEDPPALRPQLRGKAFEAEQERRRELKRRAHRELQAKLGLDPRSEYAADTLRLLHFDTAAELERERQLGPQELAQRRRESRRRLDNLRCWAGSTRRDSLAPESPSVEPSPAAPEASPPLPLAVTPVIAVPKQGGADQAPEEDQEDADERELFRWLASLERERRDHRRALREGATDRLSPPAPGVVRRALASRTSVSQQQPEGGTVTKRGMRFCRHAMGDRLKPYQKTLVRCSMLVTGDRKRRQLADEQDEHEAEQLSMLGAHAGGSAPGDERALQPAMDQEAVNALVGGLRARKDSAGGDDQGASPQSPATAGLRSPAAARSGDCSLRSPLSPSSTLNLSPTGAPLAPQASDR
eukprot:TRINITY_DN20986_c0_g1_i1.p1 TRINITY_DN20986_c0_g1~~TRINITY_DN20986_c0_g1_i1.p1  ORF type:complete len:483 (+),score=166.65 TRINITY_DN20986_c0_g1_i1:76-1449(+)